jgi:uncharacterized protein (UPF0332 family)
MTSETQAYINLANEMLREAESNRKNGFPRGTSSRAYLVMEHTASAMLFSAGF